MGIFKYPLEIGSAEGSRYERVEALVDTGAMYSWVPASILRSLGFEPTLTRPFLMADGMTVERGITQISVRLNGEELYTICAFVAEGSPILLGMITLEAFGLSVDTVNERLVRLPTPLHGHL